MMLRTFILLCLILLVSMPLEASEDNSSSISIQGLSGTGSEQITLDEITDQGVIEAAAKQITQVDYPCKEVLHLWKLRFSQKVELEIFKVQCSGGEDYQLTVIDDKGYVKPWTGTLIGN